jgi:DNA-binding GntR family transcriptional regulator
MQYTGGRTVRKIGGTEGLSLVDQIYLALRNKIITWELAPEELLVEAQLARQCEVSKTPVREALALLSQDGLIEILPRVGYRVTSISVQDVHEVFELRVVLEGEAAAIAATRRNKADLEAVQEADRAWARQLRQRSISLEEYLHFHDAFHLHIAELSGNSRLVEFISRLLRDSTRIRMRDPLMSAQGLVAEQELSARIVHALAARAAVTARHLMQQHIMESKERIMRQITQKGQGDNAWIRVG